MTRQITLLGGQILPVYLGILEKKSDEIHVIYTKETRQLFPRLTHEFPKIKMHSHQVDPYDFIGIKDLVTSIILEYENDEFLLNITSGTKVMALACQSIFNELGFEVFYIDQKHRLLSVTNESLTKINLSIKIKTFFALSGHSNYESKTLSNYNKDEIDFAYEIFEQSQHKSGLYSLFELVRTNCEQIQTIENFEILGSSSSVKWTNNSLQINLLNKQINCVSKNAFNIAFGGLWWELIIAHVTKKWSRVKEQLLGVSIKTNSTIYTKNEIDIILNTGSNLIFIECKSGNVSQGDINKMRAVNRIYGGVSIKSILVCRYSPRKDLLEKCKDLGIEIFVFQSSNSSNENSQLTLFNDLKDLLNKLDKLVLRLELG